MVLYACDLQNDWSPSTNKTASSVVSDMMIARHFSETTCLEVAFPSKPYFEFFSCLSMFFWSTFDYVQR
jgi:hypothetical protein